MLEKWQTTFTRLRSEEICMLLQEMNPITFTPANLASLRNIICYIRGQRVIPKERLLECLELATGISRDEPIVPPFFSDFQSVINYALKQHESLGNRSESLTMPPRDAENRWWIEQGLYWLEVAEDFTKLTVTQRFSNETLEIQSDGTWGPTTRFAIMHNFSYKQSVLTKDSTVALKRLSLVFDEAGWRKENMVEEKPSSIAPSTPALSKCRPKPAAKATSTCKHPMATKRTSSSKGSGSTVVTV
eukprot:3406989-Amphidinium_carterae.1